MSEEQVYSSRHWAAKAAASAQDAAQSAQNSRGLTIGQLVWSQSSLAKDNPGCLPAWTGEYYTNASTLYPDFYAWVKSHPELCKTKAEYDAAMATYGECPYYVADEVSGSLRLPKLANYIKMANSTEGITQKGAGLPNITGSIDPYVDMNRNWSGAFSVNKTAPFNPAGTSGNGNGSHVMFDASKSNAIYGASDTVQPAHTTLYPWVCAFNAAVPASTAQAAEFTGALAGKANTDLSNLSADGKDIASGLGMPSNRYIDLTLGASGATYTAPANGWILVGKRCTANQYLGTYANSIMKCLEVWNTSYCSLLFPVRKGNVFPISYSASGTTEVFRFIYAEGAE